MYRSALIVVLFGILSCSAGPQVSSVKANDEAPSFDHGGDTLNSARTLRTIERIEQMLPSLSYKDASIEGMSAEDGEIRAFYEASALVKLMATHYGEGGRKSDSYYFEKGRPIAIREIAVAYKEPIYINSNPITADSSNIIYLVQGGTRYAGSPNLALTQLPQDSLAQVVDSLIADLARYQAVLHID